MVHAAGAPYCHVGDLSLSVCGGGWFNLCTLIAQCATGVQPHPAPDSNQSDSGQVRLLKPATIHTHTPTMTFPLGCMYIYHILCCFYCNGIGTTPVYQIMRQNK
ncbi:unnamed protein product [Lota lota]